jgi:hypothetical protein
MEDIRVIPLPFPNYDRVPEYDPKSPSVVDLCVTLIPNQTFPRPIGTRASRDNIVSHTGDDIHLDGPLSVAVADQNPVPESSIPS